MCRVKHVEHAFAKRAGNDEPVVVEEQPVALKHVIPCLPVGSAEHGVVSDTPSESGYHVGVLGLVCTRHRDVAGGNGDGGRSRCDQR